MPIREKDFNNIRSRPDLNWYEKHVRSDAGWQQGPIALTLERENQSDKWDETLKKVFERRKGAAIPYRMVTFGWITSENLKKAKEKAKQFLTDQTNDKAINFLMISWIGKDAEHTSELEGYTNCRGSESICTAKVDIDSTGYWHFHSLSDWSPPA